MLLLESPTSAGKKLGSKIAIFEICFFLLGSSTPLSPQPSVSLTESASTLSSEDVSDLPVEDSGILAEYTSDGLEVDLVFPVLKLIPSRLS